MEGERSEMSDWKHAPDALYGGENGPLVDPGDEAETSANPVNQRRALRRLQSEVPSQFEQLIDLLYEWREYAPSNRSQVTDLMRALLHNHHNISDADAIEAMKRFIQEARKEKIFRTIGKIGFDKAERLLGMKDDE